MANQALDSFLEKLEPAPEAPPPPAEPEPVSTGVSEPEAKATPDAVKPDDAEDDDGAPPAPKDGESVVPLHALEATRRARNDWKDKAARAEGELAALRRQLEEAKAAPPAPPAQPQPMPQPQPTVSFAEDPEGWAAQLRMQQQEMLMHERANISEMRLNDKIGPEKVAEMKAEFKRAAEADPTLYQKLRQQLDPYAWANAEVERLRLLADVGDDPAAYRAKIEAEARAKWEAELAAQPQPEPAVSPAAGQPRSLATVRSVAARAAPAFTGEPTITQILAQRKF
jgi:hypothetical protein